MYNLMSNDNIRVKNRSTEFYYEFQAIFEDNLAVNGACYLR